MRVALAAVVLGVSAITLTSFAQEINHTCIFAGEVYSKGATIVGADGETLTCICDSEGCEWR